MVQHTDLCKRGYTLAGKDQKDKTGSKRIKVKNGTSSEKAKIGTSLEETKEEVRDDAISVIAAVKTLYKFITKYRAYVGMVFIAVILIAIGLFKYDKSRFDRLETQLHENSESVSSQIAALDAKIDGVDKRLNGRIDELDEKIDSIDEKLSKEIDDLSGEFYEVRGQLEGAQVISANSGFVKTAIYCVSNATNSSKIDKSMVLGKDDTWGDDIVASNVENKKLLLTYEVDGTDNLFYGSFNGYGHWDGRCLINTYKNGLLYALTDAIYNDGKIIGCQQIYATTVSGEVVWTASKTIVSDNKDVEVSKSFIREKEIPIDFSMSEATTGDLLNFSDVKQYFGRQVSYYSGLSEKGSPNDVSGNAFWIKFNEEGKIVVFQSGIFINGRLNDHDSNDGVKSWEIAWGDKYYYYEEFFSNGNHDKSSVGAPVTMDEIYNLVEDFEFDFTDKWIN